MKILVILSLVYFAVTCLAANIDDDSQSILDETALNSRILKLQSQKHSVTGGSQDGSSRRRRRRQADNTEQPSLDATPIPIPPEEAPVITPPAPPPVGNPGESPAESDSIFPDHVKKTLGNVNKAVQELGSKIASTVGDFFSSVSKVVSGLVNSNNKPQE